MGAVFTCSIDDGHPLDMKMADLLSKHGIGATFYVPIRNCEGDAVLDKPQIRELSRQFEIGSHTYDHCYLKAVDIRQSYRQIHDGKRMLEDTLGTQVNGFCYPGGRYRQCDVDLVKACNFTYARTTMNLCFDAGNKPFEMPTTIQFYPHVRSVYLRNYAGSGEWLKRADGLRLALQHDDWIKRLYGMFDHACRHDAVFHLWGHTKQVEQLGAWDELDRFLSHVAAAIPHTHRLSNQQLAARVPAFDGRETVVGQSA